MSARLPVIKEKLASIRSKLNVDYTTGYRLRLDKVSNIVVENESKIWLRTRVGEPMLKELQDSIEKAYDILDGEGVPVGFEMLLRDIEAKASKIDEESRRRDMVVT
ncbi:MAG: hypothetical protein ABSA11_04795 [Candidatus Bathyarchaeia archaeon]|jgi:hypothetical protein